MNRQLAERMRAPVSIYACTALVYLLTLWTRMRGPSDNAHFVSLAESYLHGQLSVIGDRPPGNNDWASFGGRWYVVFPPLPALMIMPAVVIWHEAVWDRLYWALFAGLGPALLYVLLRYLREHADSGRSPREDLALTLLFAFGSIYYCAAVQGAVWFAAHVVACPLIALYVLFALDARRPLLAGCMLGLAWATRPTTLLLAPFFAIEALARARRDAATLASGAQPIRRFLRGVDWRQALRAWWLFGLPLLAIVAISCWLNWARFGDPFEVGYRYLRIRWAARIEKWGLFNYHYVSKNLAVFLAALPWLSNAVPYVRISRHGLALWVTTPNFLGVLWPKRVNPRIVGLSIAAACVALMDLAYQNSGWIQFGYRFSLDYSVLLIVLLALGARRFGVGFCLLLAWSIAVNTFGAWTFDRAERFYDHDGSQQVIFQPD